MKKPRSYESWPAPVRAMQNTDEPGRMPHPTSTQAIFDWVTGGPGRPVEERIAASGWTWHSDHGSNRYFVFTSKGQEWVMPGDWVVVGPANDKGRPLVRVIPDHEFKILYRRSAE